MVEEAVVCWRVVGLVDGVFDGVVEVGDGLALVADLEAVVSCGDGGGSECSCGDGGGYRPVGVGEVDGVVFGDVADEGDASVAEWDGEVAVFVEVVRDGDGGWPSQLVGVVGDVFGGVAGGYPLKVWRLPL